ncbi:MAG TPA: PKD domain-containing protein [Bacteroidales bacterium]|nr:PKD domain-containing protein [Bacteroidales bacterium]HQM69152.1 PKD domain-containing protein [Bacteroidales bacterium]
MFILYGHSLISYSQVDTEFWFVVPELSHRGNTGGTPGTLRIATLELPATVTISMPANPYHPTSNPNGFQDIVVDIPANSTSAVNLTSFIDVAANPANNKLENKPLTTSGINNFGLHITATNMITAYWEVNYAYGSDLWTLKGRNAIGTLFYTPFQTTYDNRNFMPRTYSAIDIGATTDNTQITITLPVGKSASYGQPFTTIPAGGTYTLILNKGQTFSLFPASYSILASDRLAGTRIEANEPICVTVKDDALDVGSQGMDVIGDQIVPVNIVGSHYIVPEIWNPNNVYVLATEDNTNIYVYDGAGIPIGSSPYATLNRGQQAHVIIPGGSKFGRITSSLNLSDPGKPFYTFQLGGVNQARAGALVPAIGCTGNTQLAFTRARDENRFNFFIIVKKGNEDKFLLDGIRQDGIIDPGAFTEIPGSGGYMAWFSNSINANILTIGQHLVENTGDIFHLGIFNGFTGAGQGGLYYGYYSDFGGLNVGANVAGTNSVVVRACYGDPVQLYAYGGTNYQWTPDTYLDDATSNLPTAINLPPGPHNYSVEVSGACATGIIDLTVLVSTPVVAFFETNVTSGCSPLKIQFDDKSSGGFSWQYEIGGTLIKYDLDPDTPYPPPPNYPEPFSLTHTYINTTNSPITDTVTLLVKNASGCSDIFTKTIVVFPEVYSAFSIPGLSRGCDPLAVQFQNNSTGNTDTWYWDFGDGGSSVDQNPQHTFRNLFGPDSIVYETKLIAISPYYCRDTSFHTVTVMPYIEANFVFDTVFACTPHEIVITDQSFGADFYFWDFGDGETSISPGPRISKKYINDTDDPVTYTIKLRVVNEEGCEDEIVREVIVFPEINASFTTDPDVGCSPFEVEFINNSTGASSYYWNFGDGGTSSEEEPRHLFERNLMDHDTTYAVTLIATSSEFCRDTMSMDIVVHPYIEASFAVNDIVGCHPFQVTITNRSVGVDRYLWDFGDGSPVLTTDEPTFEHLYFNEGTSAVVYTLQLLVFNEEGCSDTLTRYITVHPDITPNFSTSALNGCHPLTVKFTDLSIKAVNYFWDFGDGSSSVTPSPEHTFTNFGSSDITYTVTLTVSTADGECVKSVSWPILVHPQVIAGFTLPKVIDCNPSVITFENISVGGDTYTWNFGDGPDTITTDLSPVTHTFVNSGFVNIREFEVVLTARNNEGCSDVMRKTVRVYPDIQAVFTASPIDGCHPLNVQFSNLTQGNNAFIWDFGDGTSSSMRNPSHTFRNTGTIDSTYRVILKALSPNLECSDTVSIQITVHPDINAQFTFDQNIDCTPFEVEFHNASTAGNTYYWDFGDKSDTITTDLNSVSHIFRNDDFVNTANFNVTLTAENTAGCPDIITKTVMVYPAIQAAFSMDINEGCHPLKVNFTNSSEGGFTYLWDFGDGTSSSSTSPGHVFNNFTDVPVTRQIRLIATSRFNCTSEFTAEVTIHPRPKARFETDRIENCPPFDVMITNTSLNSTHFLWKFGDGEILNTDSGDPVNHVYYNQTSNILPYTIRLIASTSYGCVDSTQQNIIVYPSTVADFSVNDEGCTPLTSYFINESVLGESYLWSFGDGSEMTLKDPSHTYFNFTPDVASYYVTLTSTSSYGCIDSKTDTINVYPQPVAEFIAQPSHQVFPASTVSITNTTSPGNWTYLWEMGDGSSSNLAAPLPHTYSSWGEYEIKLYVSSEQCRDSVSHKIRIFPGPPVADFDTVYPACEPYTVKFSNNSLYGDSYLWEFDDGTSSTEFEPTHTFTGDGIYNVKLTVNGEGGRDYAYRQVEVYPKPLVNFRLSPELVMLPDQKMQLFNLSENGTTYLWNFGDGNTSTEMNPEYLYSDPGVYDVSLDVWTDHGCTDRLVKPKAVTVLGKGFIKFPNAFEPNLNGPNNGYYNLNEPELNTVFHPYWEGVEEYRLEIYNRWGVLLYVSLDVMKGWDGYYQDKVSPQGVYVYKCTGTFSNGMMFNLVGDVTLLHHIR